MDLWHKAAQFLSWTHNQIKAAAQVFSSKLKNSRLITSCIPTQQTHDIHCKYIRPNVLFASKRIW